jgi:23S rRNA (adenine2030-N6)-methyltransferase
MNYRHTYHAGNFADVFKHAVLVRIIEYLKRKEKAFRVIDTHAGTGRYDLASPEARKTGEWRGGIGRFSSAPVPDAARTLLAPYLDLVRQMNPDGALDQFQQESAAVLRPALHQNKENERFSDVMKTGRVLDVYPGSPLIARKLLRRQDRLSAIEKHPQDADGLRKLFFGDHQVKVMELDGWLALGAHVPPKEKRGVVLVDPPFEEEGEFARMADGLKKAHRRWPGGIYAFWYPVKDRAGAEDFREALKRSGLARILDCTLMVRPPAETEILDGSGMVIVNPPYTLEAELRVILPALAGILGEDKAGRWSLEWLTGEMPPYDSGGVT